MPETYKVMMSRWHDYDYEDKICVVCLAGSVMAMHLGIPAGRSASPYGDSIDCSETVALDAIDQFRVGNISFGLGQLGLPLPSRFFDSPTRIAPYLSENPSAFKSDMRKLADELEEAGF